MKWYLFILFVNMTTPMQAPNPQAQAVKMYDDSDRVTCEADGRALVALLNNPLHVTTNQKVVYTCINF